MDLERISIEADGNAEGFNEVLEVKEKLEKLPSLFEDIEKPKLKVYTDEDSRIILECLEKGYIFSGEMGFELNTLKPNEYLFRDGENKYKVIFKN